MEPAIWDHPTVDRAAGVVVKILALLLMVVGAAMTVAGFANPVLLVFGVPLLLIGVVFFVRSWHARSGLPARGAVHGQRPGAGQDWSEQDERSGAEGKG